MSPVYRYKCMKERGGCDTEWNDSKPIHARHDVMCAYCSATANEAIWVDPVSRKRKPVVELLLPDRVHVISDIDWQDGRTGDPVEIPSLGPGHKVSSRSELTEDLKRLREAYFEQTDGPKEITKHYRKDPNDPESPIVEEKVTKYRKGIDLGEIHPVDDLPAVLNDPASSFEPGKKLSETEKDLEKRVGKPDEPPKPKGRGRPKGAKDKAPRKKRVGGHG